MSSSNNNNANNSVTNSNVQVSHEGEHHGDYGQEPVSITNRAYLYAFCAAVNSCNLGYDIGVSTNAGHLIQRDLNWTEGQREMFVGSINFWAIFGALSAQYFTDAAGRRRTFVVAALSFIAGMFLQAIGNSYALLMIGRVFVGLGVGVGLAIDPLYIAEMTPAKHRGSLVTWSEIALNLGIVFGFSTGILLRGLNDSVEWRVMFALGCILPVVMIVLVYSIMPETPRWLVSKHLHDEARVVLQEVYPAGFDVEPVIVDIQESLELEQAAEHAVGWGVIFRPSAAFRRMLLVGVGTAVAQQAVGIDAIQYYLLDVMEESGIQSEVKQDLILIFLGILKLSFILVGGMLFDKRGRRPLLFASLLGMAGALLMVSIAFLINDKLSAGFTVFGLALYLSFFSIGMGPGAWLISSEVFATCIRAKAMSVATTMNRVTATLMSSTFLSTANAMGWAGFFFLLFVVCLIVLAFLYACLPETRGRSLEDMSLYFAEITGDRAVLEAEAKIAGRRGPSTEMTPTTTTTTSSPRSPTAAAGAAADGTTPEVV